jgi:hypothetical protein
MPPPTHSTQRRAQDNGSRSEPSSQCLRTAQVSRHNYSAGKMSRKDLIPSPNSKRISGGIEGIGLLRTEARRVLARIIHEGMN